MCQSKIIVILKDLRTFARLKVILCKLLDPSNGLLILNNGLIITIGVEFVCKMLENTMKISVV